MTDEKRESLKPVTKDFDFKKSIEADMAADEVYKNEVRLKRRNKQFARSTLIFVGVIAGTILIYAFSAPGSTSRRIIEFVVELLIGILDEL